MSRRARTCGLLIFATCALAAFPSPAGAQTVFGQVRETLTVPAGAVRQVTIRCPRGFAATSGTVISFSGGITTTRSSPTGRDGWTFAFDNSQGSAAVEIRVMVKCLKIAPKRAVRRVRYRIGTVTKAATLVPGQLKAVRVNCPSGRAPVGYGAETESGPGGSRARARASGIGTIGDVVLNQAMPVRGGWAFELLPLGQRQRDVRLHARCGARMATGSGGGRSFRLNLEVSRRTYEQPVKFLENDGITRNCPRGREELREGHEFPEPEAGRIFLSTSWSDLRGVTTWNIFSTIQADVTVKLYQLCFRRLGSWRRTR